MKSIYMRQFAWTAGLILLSFALLGASFIFLSYRYILEEKKASLDHYANRVSSFTANYLATGQSIQAYQNNVYWGMLDFFAEFSDSYLVLSNAEGQVLCITDGTVSNYYQNVRLPESIVEMVLTEGGYTGNNTLNGLFPQRHYVAGKPVMVAGVPVGIIFATADISSLTEFWRSLASLFFIVAVVVFCIAFLSSSVTSRRQTRPLKEMAEAVRKFGHGQLDVRVNNYGRVDEIGELATAFNHMAETLGQEETQRREFIANISHELKTPMTIIAGFSDGILDGTIPDYRQAESLRVISAETRRLSRLVLRMLDISHLQAQENAISMSTFDIAEVLRRVLVGLESKVNARALDVDAQLPEEPVLVTGDADAITQVCYNLLDNAIKFSNDGETIGIALAVGREKVRVAIRNRGVEIPPAELPLIFDRFHKTDRSRSIDRDGVGLGLYIVKTILNNHKENITVTSEDGVNEVIFTLSLSGERK